jgi:hypothetical protein
MSFSNGELSAADVAAVTGNGGGFGFGNGDGGFWLLILFLFAMMGGWNNNNGNNPGNCANAAAIPAVQAGFDQAAVMNGITGLTSAVSNGFANAELSRANTQANLTGQLNGLAMALQNCCCENRSATADLKYTVATENCADRQALSDGLRDITASNTANTQAILNAINGGIQNIQDKLCQQEIDALKTENANLQTQINLANLQASQTGQTARILADNAAQTSALEQYLNPTPKPAYIVQNPNGCGCGNAFGGCCA